MGPILQGLIFYAPESPEKPFKHASGQAIRVCWRTSTPNCPPSLFRFALDRAIIFLYIILFMYLVLAVLGLSLLRRLFSGCSEWGLLNVVASLVAEHRLQGVWAQ